jgi:hypothetical protein
MTSADESEARQLRARAFLHQTNLILLGGTALFSLALWSLWPLVAGLVGEVLWLGVASNSPRFRRLVSQERGAETRRLGAVARAQAVARLEPSYAAQVRNLETLADEVRRLTEARGLDPLPLDRPDRGLDSLLLAYAKLAVLHQQLSQPMGGRGGGANAEGTNPVAQELARIGAALAEEKDPTLRLSLRQAMAIGQRRLKQHEQVDIQRRALGIKMSTLEMSFDYLRSHIFGGTTEQDLARELDEVHAGLTFLPAAEAEAQAAIAKLQSPVVTRVTGVDLPVMGRPGA